MLQIKKIKQLLIIFIISFGCFCVLARSEFIGDRMGQVQMKKALDNKVNCKVCIKKRDWWFEEHE